MSRLYLTAALSLLLWQPGNLMMSPSNGEPLSHADIRAMARGPLPDWILAIEPPLSHTEVLCYVRLLRRINAEGRCWPKQSTLASELRCSERHVRGLIQRLADLGLIRIERRDGSRQNQYVLIRNEALMNGKLATAEDPEIGTAVPVTTPAKQEPQFRSDRNSSSGIGSNIGTPLPIKQEPQFRSDRNSSSYCSMKSTKEVHQGSNLRPPSEDSAESEDRKGVVAELGNAGVHLEIASRLLTRYPEALQKARNWAKWLPSVRRGMEREGQPLRDVEGYLARHLSGRCHTDERRPCIAPDCDVPRHYLDCQPRAVATRTSAPRPAQPARQPDCGIAVLPELEPVWSRLLEGVNSPIRAHLSTVTAVNLDGAVLEIELPSLNADLLKRHRDLLLDLARDERPELSELRFLTTKGGR